MRFILIFLLVALQLQGLPQSLWASNLGGTTPGTGNWSPHPAHPSATTGAYAGQSNTAQAPAASNARIDSAPSSNRVAIPTDQLANRPIQLGSEQYSGQTAVRSLRPTGTTSNPTPQSVTPVAWEQQHFNSPNDTGRIQQAQYQAVGDQASVYGWQQGGAYPCPQTGQVHMVPAVIPQQAAMPTPWVHTSKIWGEFLFLRPAGANVAHAQQQDGVGGFGTVPFGTIGVADPSYSPGFRVGGDWAFDQCTSLGVAYTHFESSTRDTLSLGNANAIGSLVVHPGIGNISTLEPVSARYDINYQLADVRFRSLLGADTDVVWVNYSMGLRYAHLEQNFRQTGNFTGTENGTIRTNSDITFDGGGPFFGLDGEQRIGRGGCSLYGNLGVSPMVGRFTSVYQMYNETTDTLLVRSRWSDNRIVTMLEMELGIAWTGPNRRWRISSGYYSAYWFNVVTTPTFIDAVRSDNYVDVGSTLSFDGLVARIERRF